MIDLLGGRKQFGFEFGERLVGVDAGFLGCLLRRGFCGRFMRRPLGRAGAVHRDGGRTRPVERPRQLLKRLGEQLG